MLDMEERLSHAKESGKVSILNLQFLPKKVFETIIALSHYPAVAEGANLTNLLQQLGIPYLSVLPEGRTPLPDFDSVESSSEYRALEKMHIASGRLSLPDPNSVVPIKEFIEGYSAKASGYQELTQRLQQEATSPLCDQVLYSLVALAIAEGHTSPKPVQGRATP